MAEYRLYAKDAPKDSPALSLADVSDAMAKDFGETIDEKQFSHGSLAEVAECKSAGRRMGLAPPASIAPAIACSIHATCNRKRNAWKEAIK